ncbi:MAG TPA: hypothetical protein VLA72_23120 [Anaerolineales bacterium]|nr:hypothetical protein [Anaerolineales bacterium]
MEPAKELPKINKITEYHFDGISDELWRAYEWSRPSFLICVHRSKKDQATTLSLLEDRLEKEQLKVMEVVPKSGRLNVLSDIIQDPNCRELVFFIQNLGSQAQVYDGLNLHREKIVEQQLKVVLWLTTEELLILSKRAPDFWAFRHRVFEFPTKRHSKKYNLPCGVLMWRKANWHLSLDAIHKNISMYEALLSNTDPEDDKLPVSTDAIEKLAYGYWFVGKNREAEQLMLQIYREFEQIKNNIVKASFLNILAIINYDMQDYQKAFQWIEKALEIQPDWNLLWTNYGVICRSVGRSNKSLSSLKKALNITPKSTGSLTVLSYMYMFLGQYMSALPWIEREISIHPKNTYILPALAACYQKIGNVDDFDLMIQRMSSWTGDNAYIEVCCDGLLKNEKRALEKLKKLMLDRKMTRAFIRRDPNFHFIFDASTLQDVVAEPLTA